MIKLAVRLIYELLTKYIAKDDPEVWSSGLVNQGKNI